MVDGGRMPDVTKLPTNLLPLTFAQAMLLRTESARDDADKIAGRLRHIIASSHQRPGMPYWAAGIGAVAILVAGLLAGPLVLNRAGLPFPFIGATTDKRLGALKTESAGLRAQLSKAKSEARRQRDLSAGLPGITRERDQARAALAKARSGLRDQKAALRAQAIKAKADYKRLADEAAKTRRELESRHKADAAKQKRLAALKVAEEAKRKAIAAAIRREPASAIKPGSGKSFRDRLANGKPCAACPEMVVVPPGSFMMGSPASEKGRDKDEGPPRKVTIANPFAVGRFEVTFAEWDACVAAGGCKHKPGDGGWGRGRQPVIKVSRHDAYAYVTWLSKTTGRRYRLLSEEEWEYAARAGTTTRYAFGDTITKQQAQFSRSKATKVGTFKPNAFGLYDMHGNVWERVADCGHETYTGGPKDVPAWTTRYDCDLNVLRGGSWSGAAQYGRSASRVKIASRLRLNIVGFRLARTLTP